METACQEPMLLLFADKKPRRGDTFTPRRMAEVEDDSNPELLCRSMNVSVPNRHHYVETSIEGDKVKSCRHLSPTKNQEGSDMLTHRRMVEVEDDSDPELLCRPMNESVKM